METCKISLHCRCNIFYQLQKRKIGCLWSKALVIASHVSLNTFAKPQQEVQHLHSFRASLPPETIKDKCFPADNAIFFFRLTWELLRLKTQRSFSSFQKLQIQELLQNFYSLVQNLDTCRTRWESSELVCLKHTDLMELNWHHHAKEILLCRKMLLLVVWEQRSVGGIAAGPLFHTFVLSLPLI